EPEVCSRASTSLPVRSIIPEPAGGIESWVVCGLAAFGKSMCVSRQCPHVRVGPERYVPSQGSSDLHPNGLADGYLHRRRWQRRVKFTLRQQRGLGHETRLDSAMRLCGVDQKGMAEIDRPGLSGGQHFFAVGSRCEAVSCEFAERKAILSMGQQLLGNCAVRPFADLSWCIQFPDIGEKEQHKQGAAAAF